ncbi:hypothetical protein [Tissierella praeacuta]|uniref:hypothetical protein n=1 Tax=Tissierella praeacuta TaxID=43131 RepID=UPI0028AEC202|nr:hypothetical protein [Tissierella praeacuta]
MDNIEMLRKLIDEDAITFMKANEENIDLQWNSFLETNGFICGIDLSEGKDWTPIPPYR